MARDTVFTFTEALPRDTGFLAFYHLDETVAGAIRWSVLENASEAIRRLLGAAP